MKHSTYYPVVRLLLTALPSVSEEKVFALKGGTAINLFLRNMSRLSVDIDLTYLPLQPREESFKGIYEGLKRIAERLKNSIKDVKISFHQIKGISVPTTINVTTKDATIKIETNLVLRGSVFAPQVREVSLVAQNMFEIYTEMQLLSDADIYGGKLCAALDRQHPRDLYDVMVLLNNEGITDDIRKAFIVYLASHSRPMSELLSPNLKDISEIYEKEFIGMTSEPVELKTLLDARDTMLRTIRQDLTPNEKAFLISIKEGNPNWQALEIEGIENLPGLQWKLSNIKKMSEEKRVLALGKLKELLDIYG
jgi:predicted nucleotidyltransferase component of viral defense system